MKEIKVSFVENKKSKFYGYMYKVNSIDEVKEILNTLQKEHKKAKHITYGYKIGNIEKNNSDKEPSGTVPILNIINLKKEDNILIVVVRYFGGTLLGRGLLTRSYSEAVSNLFK